MSNPILSLETAAKVVRGRYCPTGNTHRAEWEDHHISVSKLVGKTATEYAESIIARQPDTVDRYWSFIGNTLGDGAFHRDDGWFHEGHVSHPIQGKWTMSGHFDAIQAIGNYVVLGEHKAHASATEEAIEKAFRQGTLYLAMAWDTVKKKGHHKFPRAKYAPKSEPEFDWKEEYRPAGVIVAVAERFPPGLIQPRPLTQKDLAEAMEFYIMKASHIVMAVETGDLAHARAWDEGPGAMEFDRALLELNSPVGGVERIVAEKKKADREKAKWEARCSALNEQLRFKLRELGMWDRLKAESLSIGEYSLKVVVRTNPDRADVDALKAAGLKQYVRPGGTTEYTMLS